jgi:hypothetical protein
MNGMKERAEEKSGLLCYLSSMVEFQFLALEDSGNRGIVRDCHIVRL